MKGPQGLASKFDRRRCRTAKNHRRWVSRCFSFRPAEIEQSSARKLRSGGSLRRATMTRGVTPASDVTDRTKDTTNPGSAAAAGVMPGAWSRADCTDGRLGDRNAAVWECAASRSPPVCRWSETAARQWRCRSRVRVVPNTDATTKAATGLTRLDGVPAGRVARSACGTRAAWSGEIRFGKRMSSGNGATTWSARMKRAAVLIRGFRIALPL